MSRTNFKTKAGTELPLLNLKGKEYLQVAYRVQWFREDHPDWSIETTLVNTSVDSTIFKATIKAPDGRIMATAHKKEDIKGFPDHMEKSETGSIGRALALIGYGTQFAPDLNEGERLADSPMGKVTLITDAERAKAEKPLYCKNCGTELKYSDKSGGGFYCPKFKDQSRGSHTYVPIDHVNQFLADQEGGQTEGVFA